MQNNVVCALIGVLGGIAKVLLIVVTDTAGIIDAHAINIMSMDHFVL